VEIVEPKVFGAGHDTLTDPLCKSCEEGAGGPGTVNGIRAGVVKVEREFPAALVAKTANLYVFPPVIRLYPGV